MVFAKSRTIGSFKPISVKDSLRFYILHRRKTKSKVNRSRIENDLENHQERVSAEPDDVSNLL